MLKKTFMHGMHLAGQLIVNSHIKKYIRPKNDIRFVFYHGVGDGKSQCMNYLNDEIEEKVFSDHLDYLIEKYTLVSLADTVNITKNEYSKNQKPLCNISFDDGLYSVYSKAFPLLKKKSIPFDVFLNTSVIGNNSLLWLHLLNYLFSNYGLSSVVDAMSIACGVDIKEVVKNELDVEDWFRENFELVYQTRLLEQISAQFSLDIKKIANKQKLYLDWDQIDEMTRFGAGFYSHTHSHFPLKVFSDVHIIKNELKLSYEKMKLWNENSVLFVSFPFGMEKDYGERTVEQAISVGHKFVVEVGDGLNRPDRIFKDKIISRVCLGRVPGDTSSLYTEIELIPVVKSKLKKIMGI